jgi:hypothetical protein
LVVPHDLVLMAKVLGVALAVGPDVLAVSVGVGVMQLVLNVRLRLGFAFAGSEIAMQSSAMNLAQAPESCWPRLPPTLESSTRAKYRPPARSTAT